jgi:hypothetical protein
VLQPLSLSSVGVLVMGALVLSACGSDSDAEAPDGGVPVADVGFDATDIAEEDTGPTDPPPPLAPFRVLYVQESAPGSPDAASYRQVMATDGACRVSDPGVCGPPGTCSSVEIEPPSAEEGLCQHGCFFPPSLSHIVFFDANQSRTLRYAPLGADLQLAGNSVVIATDLASVSVGEDLVVYRIENSVRAFRLSSGQETTIATVTGAGTPWVSPDGSRVFLRRVTSLTSMDLVELNPAAPAETPVYSFVDGVPASLAGSLLAGTEPLALSPDGTRLAMLASIRVAGSACGSNADCTGSGQTCPIQSENARCFSHETVLYVLNLDEVSRLGGPCSSLAECGADHQCDLSAPASDGTGVCMPGRIVVGPGGPQACERIETGAYNLFRSSLLWRSNRSVVGLFVNNCTGQDIPTTDVVAVDAGTGVLTRLTQNPGVGHGGPACYNSVEECYRVDQCQVEFKSFALSPDGGTVVAVGNSYTSRLSDHLWSIDAFGRTPRAAMTRSIRFNVRAVAAGELP